MLTQICYYKGLYHSDINFYDLKHILDFLMLVSDVAVPDHWPSLLRFLMATLGEEESEWDHLNKTDWRGLGLTDPIKDVQVRQPFYATC